MDYEIMYQNYLELDKLLKEKSKTLTKLQKSIGKAIDTGEIKNFPKDILAIQNTNSDIAGILEKMESLVNGFDIRTYIEQGFFASQMVELCKQQQVDVIGEFPNYEMFPFSVHIDADTQEISINKKKILCARPSNLVQRIKSEKEKLMKASFNAEQFINELANAYDIAILKLKKPPRSDIYLLTIYKYLVPMSRFRKDYDQQSFSFDIARIFSTDVSTIKDGRSFQFGPSRNNKKAIRILDREGHEHYLATIRFF